MKTKDQILKIRATVLYILQSFPNGIDYIKLFKILYFSQQLHLVKYGRVIIEDTFQARQYGPVSSFIRKGLKLKEVNDILPEDFSIFVEGINIQENEKKLQLIFSGESPDLDELSVSELNCLNHYIKEFKDLDSDIVSKISHEDEAWKLAFNRWQKDPQQWNMSILEIAKAGGANENTLEYIKENLEIDQFLN